MGEALCVGIQTGVNGVKRALSFERPLREIRLPERSHIETSIMDGTILTTMAQDSSAATGPGSEGRRGGSRIVGLFWEYWRILQP